MEKTNHTPGPKANALIAAAPKLLEALEEAYLKINILVEREILNGSHMLAVETDGLRANMRNALSAALGKPSQELQDNVCQIAKVEAKSAINKAKGL